MKKANYGIMIVFLFLSLFVFISAASFEQTLIQDDYVGAAFFPEVLAGVTALLALFLGWLNRRGMFDEDTRSLADLFPREIRLPLAGLLLLTVYVLLLEPLGFILATFLLNISLLLLFGVRSLLYLLIFSSVISLAVYTVFYKILIVPLPEGILSF